MTADEDEALTAANAECQCGHGNAAHETGVVIRTYSGACGAADCVCARFDPVEIALARARRVTGLTVCRSADMAARLLRPRKQ